ncbi:MerR family transcriptional regulator [Streptomyces pinistramenti]|uniref:MerR family transcriptional regulator n=1 Tax=Streptomyces pinistramenti TaxID=2884812 RepID=UPI001D05E216|nr:MerR family transcriptional regulator [Streptomyces pinistramenti]MCB5910203.1 MerR family transcriptional regulator [Streptomyces pinistramenti]
MDVTDVPGPAGGPPGGDAGQADSRALLTIGAFARASRLSPKALRLYDELGLLRPDRVDPLNGYRRYAPDQLEAARLVARLRRLGMPLGRIREVCALPHAAAADAVAAYWAQAEADTAARRDLAAFLVDQLSRKGTTMNAIRTPLAMRAAAGTDGGLVRTVNQDTAYAGPRLLAVADGYGPGGGPAGVAAVDALAALEDQDQGLAQEQDPAGTDLLHSLEEAALRANRAVQRLGADRAPGDAGGGDAGSTLTALLRSGPRFGLLHVGDSRAYVLRDSGLVRITHDHSLVQSLVDEGRLSPDEAPGHPQRALLVRALDGGAAFVPDLDVVEARPGDRYLLCTDGLHGVLPTGSLQDVLAAAAGPEEAVRDLIALAREAGGPDNIGCVVADLTAA